MPHEDNNALSSKQAYLQALRKRYSLDAIRDVIQKLANLRVLVVGDLIVDEYCYCQVTGTVTKSPVIAAIYESEHLMAGGGAVVARHARGVAKNVHYLATVGDRNYQHKNVEEILSKEEVSYTLIPWPNSYTVLKRRFISGSYPSTLSHDSQALPKPSNRLFEIGYMPRTQMPKETETRMCSFIEQNAKAYDLVILTDFGHGAVTPKIGAAVAQHAQWWAVNAQTNSSNFGFNRITKYPNASYVCIDELEARLPLGDKVSPFTDIAAQLKEQLHCNSLMVTRGTLGLTLFRGHDEGSAPALADRVIDTVGAGDAVLAISSLAERATIATDLVTLLGACYGAIASQTLGNEHAVSQRRLDEFLKQLWS